MGQLVKVEIHTGFPLGFFLVSKTFHDALSDVVKVEGEDPATPGLLS